MEDPTAGLDAGAPGSNVVTRPASPWSERDMIPKLIQQRDGFRKKLEPRKKQVRMWTSRFLHDANVFDRRTEKERATRPFMLDPHVYTNIMAMVTHLVDQFMASSPQLKVRGRGWEDQGDAALERLLQYDLIEANPAAKWVGAMLRRAAIAGVSIARMRHVEEYDTVKYVPTAADHNDFRAAADAAFKDGAGEHPANVADYAMWAQKRRSSSGIPMPMLPVEQSVKVLNRVGPVIDVVSLDDLDWDPAVETIEDQPCIWYTNYPRRDVLLDLAERNPKIYDIEAIRRIPAESNAAIKSAGEIRKATFEALGIKCDESDGYEDRICLSQRWEPRGRIRYAAIANDAIPITRDPNYYPHIVSRLPFFGFFNVPTDGASIGISEYQPNGLLSDWLDKVQSMQLFWMALRTFTPLAVASGSNLKQILEDNCIPGGIVEVDDFDDVRPLFEKFSNETPLADNMLSIMRANLDRASGINETTRGEQATLNRVTGQEFAGRQGAMQVRMKDRLYRFGAMLNQMAQFDCALRYQYSDRAVLANIAGLDPFMAYNRNVLLPGISSDYIFTPASISADANLQAQQLIELGKVLQGIGALVPGGEAMMQYTMRTLQALRIPGAEELAKSFANDAQGAKQIQQLQQQLEASTTAQKKMQTENDKLRAKLVPPVPPAEELQAEMNALQAPNPTPMPEAAPAPVPEEAAA